MSDKIPMRALCALVAAFGMSGARAQSPDPLTAPAINPSAYRQDALHLEDRNFGDWLLRCEDVVPLQKRFCNIIFPLRGEDGEKFGYFLITTDENGNAGVLMKIKPPILVARPTVVSTSYLDQSKKKPKVVKYETKVGPTFCAATCDYVFPLDPRLVYALNEGNAVAISMLTPEMNDWRAPMTIRPRTLQISGDKFKEALEASAVR